MTLFLNFPAGKTLVRAFASAPMAIYICCAKSLVWGITRLYSAIPVRTELLWELSSLQATNGVLVLTLNLGRITISIYSPVAPRSRDSIATPVASSIRLFQQMRCTYDRPSLSDLGRMGTSTSFGKITLKLC